MGLAFVDFDVGAATAARDACTRKADAIDAFVEQTRQQAIDIHPDWKADTHTIYLDRLVPIMQALSQQADALRGAAGQIDGGIERAYAENAERKREAEERQREEAEARRRQQESRQPVAL